MFDDKTITSELLLNIRIATEQGLEYPELAANMAWRICSLVDEWRADRQPYE